MSSLRSDFGSQLVHTVGNNIDLWQISGRQIHKLLKTLSMSYFEILITFNFSGLSFCGYWDLLTEVVTCHTANITWVSPTDSKSKYTNINKMDRMP